MLFLLSLQACYLNPAVELDDGKLEVEFFDVCDPKKTQLIVQLQLENLEGQFVKVVKVKKNGEVETKMCCKAFLPINDKCMGFLDQIQENVKGKLIIKRLDGSNEETIDVVVILDD
ncbi:Hypothetical_protein [Hexamita inflata]|uniref:Hypothetical_protein n=1 Tax=Hexamita inflata TaxID=28002 RepID=A0AA86QPM6_9EUKA|nr:Hypothetical protein HINF_LOCUS41561 [Hexamita inflata]CAI9963464.1 Hypothetical protein HINF_LOCUS51109 [Hexamita inflata]